MPPRLNNIELENNGKLLTIRVNLAKGGLLSESGKSKIIASTHGNFALGDEAGTILSFNCYQPVKKGQPSANQEPN